MHAPVGAVDGAGVGILQSEGHDVGVSPLLISHTPFPQYPLQPPLQVMVPLQMVVPHAVGEQVCVHVWPTGLPPLHCFPDLHAPFPLLQEELGPNQVVHSLFELQQPLLAPSGNPVEPPVGGGFAEHVEAHVLGAATHRQPHASLHVISLAEQPAAYD
ncbi:hypothetical protein C5B42_02215 [Candidatus Cerribacteria bacterium 'Amazon FNV 2010 28 9']|uniref:Uncharacterized protein n=1 Tax=Candidatus Cerribacteria bacterium 'Amazon FNV 2010 28 9' TaxID=2081795 RepID=A0A317JT79_9BACT|nr:MAG: hypothetical protein C5B42_02215 [Candidatus Cerribacteria bacterium 'Amazon FNV 2010 28 9']